MRSVVLFLAVTVVVVSNYTVAVQASATDKEILLDTIANFAERICKDIPLEGHSTNIELKGSTQAELKGLLKQLASLGLKGSGKYEDAQFQGLLQKDLLAALQTSTDCKVKLVPSLMATLLSATALGKEKFLESLMADIQVQSQQLSELEEVVKQEIKLPEQGLLVRFPPLLNTATFNSMRVTYQREFLELDNPTRTNFIDFYRHLDHINEALTDRRTTIPLQRIMKADIVKFDHAILAYIKQARSVAQLLPQR